MTNCRGSFAGNEKYGGADEDRTHDLLTASQALSQAELQPHSEIYKEVILPHKVPAAKRKDLTIVPKALSIRNAT
jgi:hypothetical protein